MRAKHGGGRVTESDEGPQQPPLTLRFVRCVQSWASRSPGGTTESLGNHPPTAALEPSVSHLQFTGRPPQLLNCGCAQIGLGTAVRIGCANSWGIPPMGGHLQLEATCPRQPPPIPLYAIFVVLGRCFCRGVSKNLEGIRIASRLPHRRVLNVQKKAVRGGRAEAMPIRADSRALKVAALQTHNSRARVRERAPADGGASC